MSTTISGLDYGRSGRAPASSLTRFVDRWIFVLMAAWFIVITLTGFIPTSLAKIGAVGAGMRPPFPFMLHAHAVLMGAFLTLLLVQALLVATGRQRHHQKLGLAGIVLAPAIVMVGCLLVPIIHYEVWGKAYSLWLAGFLPSSVLIYLLWNTDWWQATAPRLVGL